MNYPKDFYQSIEQEDSIEDFFPNGTIIFAKDPLPNMAVGQMQLKIADISSTQELVDAYALVHNKFWYIEDDLYDYEKGSEGYFKIRENVDAWGKIYDFLEKRIMVIAKEEGLLAERQPNSGIIKQLEVFMEKYGYKNGNGWWIKSELICTMSAPTVNKF